MQVAKLLNLFYFAKSRGGIEMVKLLKVRAHRGVISMCPDS